MAMFDQLVPGAMSTAAEQLAGEPGCSMLTVFGPLSPPPIVPAAPTIDVPLAVLVVPVALGWVVT
jgi:hypothetical protein